MTVSAGRTRAFATAGSVADRDAEGPESGVAEPTP